MKFSLIVYSSPAAAGSTTALNFARALLEQGHQLYRVFFYGDGVCNGAPAETATTTQPEPGSQWSELGRRHELDLVLCVTAAELCGITYPAEGFQLSGLGQMVDAMVNSDRCLTFR